MKVDFVWRWMTLGSAVEKMLPEKFMTTIDTAFPSDVSGEGFDIAISHAVQPTRRARKQGAVQKPDQVILMIDTRGGRFRQR